MANTIVMCGMRRREGVEVKRLEGYIERSEEFIKELNAKFDKEGIREKYFSRLDNEVIALSEREGFLVSNHLISEIMGVMSSYLLK